MFGELEARLPGLEHGLVGLADLFPERMLLPDQLLRGVAVALDPTFKASDEVPDRLTLLENLEQKKMKRSFILFQRIKENFERQPEAQDIEASFQLGCTN